MGLDFLFQSPRSIRCVGTLTLSLRYALLGPIHVLPTAFRIIPTLLSDPDWRKKYTALSAIGTLAESSAKEYKDNLEQIMR